MTPFSRLSPSFLGLPWHEKHEKSLQSLENRGLSVQVLVHKLAATRQNLRANMVHGHANGWGALYHHKDEVSAQAFCRKPVQVEGGLPVVSRGKGGNFKNPG